MTVLFIYYIYTCIILLSERAKVFIEVLHFYNSEAKRLLLMVLAVRPMVFKKLHEQGLINHANVCSVDKTRHSLWLSIPRNKHWTLGLSDISQY